MKKITVLSRGNKFLGRAEIVRVVSLFPPRERDDSAVMKIVVPNCVKIIAAFAPRLYQFGFLSLVLRDQNNRALSSGFARGAADGADDIFLGFIKDALRRIESKSIEMELVDPVATVGHKKFAHWARVRPVEINRVAPIILVLASQIIVGINAEIISVRAEVVINNIENHAQA